MSEEIRGRQSPRIKDDGFDLSLEKHVRLTFTWLLDLKKNKKNLFTSNICLLFKVLK